MAPQTQNEKLMKRIAALESQIATTREILEAQLERHRVKAVSINFTSCGCDSCNAIRVALEAK